MTTRVPMPGSQSSLREANSQRLLDALHRYGGITQVELAESTGLSAATISTIVKQLLGAGLVETHLTVRSGRRAQLVTLARRSGLVAAVQIGPRQLRVAIGDSERQLLTEEFMPLPGDHRVDTTLDRAALLVVDLVEQMGADLDELRGIGVALPTPVDPTSGGVESVGTLRGWDDVNVATVLSERLARTVLVDNDANLGALAESRFGAAKGMSDVLYVRASYTTGAGMVIGGRIHHGRRGIAGEIGHVEVEGAGAICHCGSRGCLNTVVGAEALIDRLRLSRGPLTLRDIVTLANEGDPGCRQVVADAGAAIGAVVAGTALALDPQCVVVGGELAETGDILLGPIADALGGRVLLSGLEVRPALLGRSELIGAMTLVLDAVSTVATAEVKGDRS